MYVVFAMRKMMLTSRINQIQYRLTQLSQKLADLALFGANVEDGVITPNEFMNSPASLYGAQIQFGQQAMQQAVPQAQLQMQMYLQYQQAMGNAGAMGQMMPNNGLMFNAFLRQSLESVAKSINKRIAAEENKIQMEKTRLETQQKIIQAELEQCEKAEEEGIRRSAPKYA